ncbi:MAG TPA: acyl-CoA dehydrogenase family protein [Fimbriimonas sp.]|nr:acyl-CoA dehydrogenase family protein [Fimbriimonas sp.]
MSKILESARHYLQEQIRPNAFSIDHDFKVMKVAFDGLKEQGLLALKRPKEFGGPGLSEAEFRQFQEDCSRYSGALAFLQTQHQSAVNLITKQAADATKNHYLPRMHGDLTMGLGFSQLRRAGNPICRAKQVEGGFQIDGHVPWITGKGIFDEYIIGATLPNGQALFGFIPFKSSANQSLSKPMKLAAMQAASTVTANLNGYFLPNKRVAFIKDSGWIRANDAFNITLQGHFALGCAMAGIDVIHDNIKNRHLSALEPYALKLTDEVNRCRATLVDFQGDTSEETTPARLDARAWAIEVMMRCAQSAVTSSSGSANQLEHDANRILREAIVFTVSAQTQGIMLATLNRLSR